MDAPMPPAGTPDPEWVATPIWPESYRVTEAGDVESVDRDVTDSKGFPRHYQGRRLKPWINVAGYPVVGLSGGGGGKRRTVFVHALVKNAFHGPTPDGMEILHVDGNPANCHLSNLVFGTSAQNKADIARHGRNYWSNREKCDLGHRLEGDNIAVAPSAPNRRRCVACTRARNALGYLRKTGRDGNLRELADQKYAEIMAGTNSRETALAKLVACPRDHLLIAPNLVEGNPGRLCKACNRAHSLAAHAKRMGRPFNFKVIADEKYADIMKDVPQETLDAAREVPTIPSIEVEPHQRQRSTRLDRVDRSGAPIPDLPGELWKPIPGWEHSHVVSNLARLKSIDRWVPVRGRADRFYAGRLFRPTPGRKGYLVVGLPDHTTARLSRTYQLHLLVTLAFLGPTPDGLEVLHIDGDPGNARLDNLRFGTHRENGADMVLHGRTPRDRQGDECVHGHRLEAPNLVESRLPARKCLACTRAQVQEGMARRRSGHRKGCAESHQVRADRKYREIMGTETADDLARKERVACGRGHELIPSNLVQSKLPSRCCLACHRALSAARYERSQGRDADLQALADEHYARIVGA